MINYFLKLFFRNLVRNKVYSLINILSLAVGLAAFILISLYIQYENSWDTFYENEDRLYRVDMSQTIGGDGYIGRTAAPLKEKLVSLYPEIEEASYLRDAGGDFFSSSEKLTFMEHHGFFADSIAPELFSLKFIEGNREQSLKDLYSIVISKELADKYFPEGDALDNMLLVRNKFNLRVSGVFENFPSNSHLHIDFLISMESQPTIEGWTDALTRWVGFNFFTYVRLRDGVNVEQFEKKIAPIMNEYYTDGSFGVRPVLKPISEIHLNPGNSNENKAMIYLFGGLAVFVLILSCINFSNLTTANASLRSKEVGLKKTFGSFKSQLTKQFLFESFIITLIALQLAYVIAEFCLPSFNALVNRDLNIQYLGNWELIGFTFLVSMVSALLSGFHPAIILANLRPITVLKGNLNGRLKKFSMRNVLVVLQFTISIVFTVATIYIYKQLNYYATKDLGFEEENTLIVHIQTSEDNNQSFLPLKSKLLEHPNIQNVSISKIIPFHGHIDASINWEGSDPKKNILVRRNWVGYDYMETFGMKLIAGRDFSKDYSQNKYNQCIINETAAKACGWKDPIGKKIKDNSLTIIGVVKDFHATSLLRPIQAYYMVLHNETISGGNYYTISHTPNSNIESLKEEIGSTFKRFIPEAIFEVKVLENDLNESDFEYFKNMGNISFSFSLLAIIIASLGMFGLVSFTLKRRLKEIGIRKALGAVSSQIYRMLIISYLKLLVIATMLSIPIGYILLSLNTATYKPKIEVWEFLISAIIALILILITSAYHTQKASKSNPVDAIKYE